jgi:4-aminobutyrate aminotransferase-like enzyme
MGNGFPVAALVVRSSLLDAIPGEVELFSTFGGNPVACTAALAVLAIIEDEDLVASAAEVGRYLRQGLLTLAGRHPLIGDVRGEGLLLGVELTDATGEPAAAAAHSATEALRGRGVLVSATGPAGNVLKIRPPLVFQRDHADFLLQALDEVLASS